MKQSRTWKAIAEQMNFWRDSAQRATALADELESVLTKKFQRPERVRIAFSGVGSSNYVGSALENLWRTQLNAAVESLPPPKLIPFPREVIRRDDQVVLVSISRSGNSAENLIALDLVNELCRDVYHVVFTCSEKGKLAKYGRGEGAPAAVVVLDEAVVGAGLAMDASFTNMIVAGQGLVQKDLPADILTEYGNNFFEAAQKAVEEVSKWNITSVIFLGDGALFGAAEEGAQKVEEFTGGALRTTAQAFLGQKYGPMLIDGENTLVVGFVANDKDAFQHELGVLQGLKKSGCRVVAVAQDNAEDAKASADYVIPIGRDRGSLPDTLRPPIDVIFGQLLALRKCVKHGLDPDNPLA